MKQWIHSLQHCWSLNTIRQIKTILRRVLRNGPQLDDAGHAQKSGLFCLHQHLRIWETHYAVRSPTRLHSWAHFCFCMCFLLAKFSQGTRWLIKVAYQLYRRHSDPLISFTKWLRSQRLTVSLSWKSIWLDAPKFPSVKLKDNIEIALRRKFATWCLAGTLGQRQQLVPKILVKSWIGFLVSVTTLRQ